MSQADKYFWFPHIDRITPDYPGYTGTIETKHLPTLPGYWVVHPEKGYLFYRLYMGPKGEVTAMVNGDERTAERLLLWLKRQPIPGIEDAHLAFVQTGYCEKAYLHFPHHKEIPS